MANSQVVIFPSAGIEAGVPFTLNTFLKVSNVSPPTANSGNISQTAAGDIIIGPLGDPNAAATEDVRMQGGAIIEGPARATGTIDTVSIGRAQVWPATGVGDDAVAIGRGVVIGALAAGCVAIGPLVEAEGLAVVIGSGSKCSTLASTSRPTVINSTGVSHVSCVSVVAIGCDTSAILSQTGTFINSSNGVNTGGGIAIGDGGCAMNAFGVMVAHSSSEVNGTNGIAIGRSVRAGHSLTTPDYTDCTAIGRNATATGTGVAGQADAIAIGQSVTATGNPASSLAAIAIGRGAVAAGGECVIGSLTRAYTFKFFSSTVGGEGLRVDASAVADDIRILVFDVTAAALVRVSRGAVDSGGVGFRLLRVPN